MRAADCKPYRSFYEFARRVQRAVRADKKGLSIAETPGGVTAVKSPLQLLAHFLGRLASQRQLHQALQRRPARLARRPGPPPVGGGTRLWCWCYDIFLREGQPVTYGTPPFSADAALRHFRSYFTEPKDVVAHPQLSRDEKLAILREWEQDAPRLSTSESEGMGGGEESMLGRVESP